VEVVDGGREDGPKGPIVSAYAPCDGPCADCKRDEICCDSLGRPLCNDCWHTARYLLPPFKVVRDDGFVCGSAQLQSEAEEFVAELTARDQKAIDWYVKDGQAVPPHLSRSFSARPADQWYGDRIAHPGYMAQRRAGLVAR